METTRLKLVYLWARVANYLTFLDKIKYFICLMRWLRYKRQIKKYKDIAKNPDLELKILVLIGTGVGTGVGNAIESTPLVNAIRQIWPKAWLAVRTPPGGLFDNWPGVDFFVRSSQDLKGLSFDHTFVAWAGSISANKGFCPLGQVHFTEEDIIKCAKSEREYNIDLLRRLGYDDPTPKPYVFMQQPKLQIEPARLRMCIVPGGMRLYRWRHKQWPYFGELIKSLVSKYADAQICILGTERDTIDADLSGYDRVIDLRGKLSLPETAWIINSSNVAIGNDCGPMHITGATDTAAIIIFGPSSEVKNAPAGEYVVLRNPVECAPCEFDRRMIRCQDPVCINKVSVDMVLEQIDILLENKRSRM